MVETTFFILKPNGLRYVSLVWEMLVWNRLHPIGWREFFFTEEMLGIYPGIEANPAIEEVCRTEMLGKKCMLALVKESCAIQRLLVASGQDRNPTRCEANTIRWVIGSRNPIVTWDGQEYWSNGIHRPKSLKEVREHAPLFGLTAADLII